MRPTRAGGEQTQTIVRQTWLTRQPLPESAFVAAAMTFLLAVGSAFGWSQELGTHLDASGDRVFVHHEYYRLWTTLFVHADAAHLLSNTLLFFIFGFFLYGYFGWRVFPAAALFWGGIANLTVLGTYDPEVSLVGASGVVYWMGGVWLVLYFFLSRQKNRWHRWLRSFGVALLLFAPGETLEPNVSHRTHLAGFCLGIAYGLYHYTRRRKTFLAAEVRETIIEDLDPADDLPGPDGFPVHRVATNSELTPEKSTVVHATIFEGSFLVRFDPGYVHVRLSDTIAQDVTQPVRLVIREFKNAEGLLPPAHAPLEVESADLELETAHLAKPWPLPTYYDGAVLLRLRLNGRSFPLIVEGRGLTIEAAGPGRLMS